jgi:hypothetical protein
MRTIGLKEHQECRCPPKRPKRNHLSREIGKGEVYPSVVNVPWSLGRGRSNSTWRGNIVRTPENKKETKKTKTQDEAFHKHCSHPVVWIRVYQESE